MSAGAVSSEILVIVCRHSLDSRVANIFLHHRNAVDAGARLGWSTLVKGYLVPIHTSTLLSLQFSE